MLAAFEVLDDKSKSRDLLVGWLVALWPRIVDLLHASHFERRLVTSSDAVIVGFVRGAILQGFVGPMFVVPEA